MMKNTHSHVQRRALRAAVTDRTPKCVISSLHSRAHSKPSPLIFSFGNMKKLVGKVCSGKGDFAQWIAKLNDHYMRKTGLALFPGTLNVRLDEPYHIPSNPLRIEGAAHGGTVGVNLVPRTVFGRRAFILRTDKEEAGHGAQRNLSSFGAPLAPLW